MTKNSFYIFVCFLIISCNFCIAQEMPLFVKNVYDNMYASMSNGNVVKPKLIIDNTNLKQVVSYYPEANELKIGAKFIQICRSFGKDSSNALAHVVGHELAHILLQQNDFVQQVGSGYASEEISKQMKKIQKTLRDSVFERQADEYSSFYAYIAGYHAANIGDKLLDSIYLKYNLKDKDLQKYPPLQERKAICTASLKKMSALKSLYDIANLATISKNYDFAISCYETIIKEKFPSREIYNNLSAVYLLKAIDEIDTLQFPYIFPVEIDFTSRLYSRERSIYSNYDENLIEAIRLAELALGNVKDYSKAWLNKAIAEFLLDRKVDSYYSLHKAEETLSKNETGASIKSMKAIIDNKYLEEEIALEFLISLSKTKKIRKQDMNEPSNKLTGNGEKTLKPNFIQYLNAIKTPAFDFSSEEAKKTDSLKNSLTFSKSMHIYTLKSQEFIAKKGKDFYGEKKPSFVFYKLINIPNFSFEPEIMDKLVQFQKSENQAFYIYKNWIIEIENKLLKNCFLIENQK